MEWKEMREKQEKAEKKRTDSSCSDSYCRNLV